MAFDAFMMRAVAHELNNFLSGGKVEKVLAPSKDEVFLLIHSGGRRHKLQINVNGSAPRIGLTEESAENPKVPSMFCMLLRKHLNGARIRRVFQHDFERVIELEFEGFDELGESTSRSLICEIMGRHSNLIFCETIGTRVPKNDDFSGNINQNNNLKIADYYETNSEQNPTKRILSALKIIDFSTSSKRQLLPNMFYEEPPTQNKVCPLLETEENFTIFANSEEIIDFKALVSRYIGMSPLCAKEIIHRSELKNSPEKPYTGTEISSLWRAFRQICDSSIEHNYSPTLVLDKNGEEYEFFPFDCQYFKENNEYNCQKTETFGALTDRFFAQKERVARERERAFSVTRVLLNAENRLVKKLEKQNKELADTAKKSDFRKTADLITANIYKIKQKVDSVTVTDYGGTDENGEYYDQKEVVIKLDPRFTAAQNAQKLYKKYNKLKNAETELTKQLLLGEEELLYIRSVLDALSRVNGQTELEEIMLELSRYGYIRSKADEIGSKRPSKPYTGAKNGGKKQLLQQPKKASTSDGLTILIGKNNLQNDNLTFKIAAKTDYWFHVKNRAGSHVILLCEGATPSEKALSEAARLAAINSKCVGEERVEVDYTMVKNVKKPNGSKAGFVTYDSYKTAIVSGKADDENRNF